MSIITLSGTPASPNAEIAVCLRSWNLRPPRPAFFVNDRHAVRQLPTGTLGSNSNHSIPTRACPLKRNFGRNAANTKCDRSTGPNNSERRRSFQRTSNDSELSGTTRIPASVLLFGISSVRLMKSTCRHCNASSSHFRAVVCTAKTAAWNAVSHSGF
jgi:hypothetical protein